MRIPASSRDEQVNNCLPMTRLKKQTLIVLLTIVGVVGGVYFLTRPRIDERFVGNWSGPDEGLYGSISDWTFHSSGRLVISNSGGAKRFTWSIVPRETGDILLLNRRG